MADPIYAKSMFANGLNETLELDAIKRQLAIDPERLHPRYFEDLVAEVEKLQAELNAAYDVIRASEPHTMQPHMDGHHQVHYRGSMKNLTPEQWAVINRAQQKEEPNND